MGNTGCAGVKEYDGGDKPGAEKPEGETMDLKITQNRQQKNPSSLKLGSSILFTIE